MSNEMSFRLGKRAIRLIKEGNFQLMSWEEIYNKIEDEQLLNLLSAIRNALFYGVENKTIKGIVKAGFTHSIENWNNHRDQADKDMIVIGERAIKIANEFIKKNKIKVE